MIPCHGNCSKMHPDYNKELGLQAALNGPSPPCARRGRRWKVEKCAHVPRPVVPGEFREFWAMFASTSRWRCERCHYGHMYAFRACPAFTQWHFVTIGQCMQKLQWRVQPPAGGAIGECHDCHMYAFRACPAFTLWHFVMIGQCMQKLLVTLRTLSRSQSHKVTNELMN